MELNSRQWSVYNLVKESGEKYIKQKDICERLSEEYPEFKVAKTGNFHDSNSRKILSEDIQKINESKVVQKVLQSSSSGIRIIPRENFQKILEQEKISILKKLKRFYAKVDKLNLDNQYRLTIGKEREIIEAFLNTENLDTEEN